MMELSAVGLKKDLSNVSVPWGIPNYSAGISQQEDFEYMAFCDGVLSVYTSDYNTVSYVTINGKKVQINGSSSNHISASLVNFIIGKKDSYKVEFGRVLNEQYVTFYPMKSNASSKVYCLVPSDLLVGTEYEGKSIPIVMNFIMQSIESITFNGKVCNNVGVVTETKDPYTYYYYIYPYNEDGIEYISGLSILKTTITTKGF